MCSDWYIYNATKNQCVWIGYECYEYEAEIERYVKIFVFLGGSEGWKQTDEIELLSDDLLPS